MTEEENEWVVGDILEEWSWVKGVVEQIHSAMPWVDWLPREVALQCLQGQAILHINPDGFIVSKVLTHRITGERTLLAWLVGSRVGTGNGLVEKHFDFLVKLAKALNCTRIGGNTPIEGLCKKYSKFGFRHDMTEFSISLQEKDNEI